MVKLSERFESLTATILSNKYKGKQNFLVEQVLTGDFYDKGIEQVKLILNAGKKEKFSFVLNASNTDFLNKYLSSVNIEPDSDNIDIGSRIELEAYDTGGQGTYKFGVRIINFTLPHLQKEL